MQTILHQGMPAEGGRWLAIPDACVPTYRSLGYGLRELVLRSDAELAEQLAFNRGLEQAAKIVDGYTACDDIAAKVRAQKLELPKVSG